MSRLSTARPKCFFHRLTGPGRLRLLSAAALATLLFSPEDAQAQQQRLYDITSGLTGQGGSIDITQGFQFTVTTPLVINGLGGLRFGAFSVDHFIGLWSDGGTLLASTTVTNASSIVQDETYTQSGNPIQAQWVFNSIGALTLGPGTYVMGMGTSVGALDGSVLVGNAQFSGGATFGTAVVSTSGSSNFPTALQGQFNQGVFGPNLLIAPAYWKGGVNGTWAGANWTADAAGTMTTVQDSSGTPVAVSPANVDVIFSAANPNSQGATTLDQNVSINSLTVNDTTPVVIASGVGGPNTLTIAGSNGVAIAVNNGANLSISANVTIASAHNGIDVNGNGVAAISGILGGVDGFNKTGTGTLTLSGAAANTITGPTNVTGGTLVLGKSANVLAINGDLSIGNSVSPGAPDSVVVRLGNSGQTSSATNVTIFTDGQLDLNNFSTAIGTLAMTGGQVNLGSGDLTLNGAVTVNASATGSQVTGTTGSLDLGGATRDFAVTNGAATYDFDVQSGVKNGTLNKTGAGTLRLAGTGASLNVTLNTGTLALANNAALGTAGDTFTLAGGTVVADGGDRTLASAISLTGNATIGTSLDGVPRALTFTGPMTISGGDRILNVNNDALTTFGDVALGANILAISGTGNTNFAGVISSSGSGNGFLKADAATLTFSGVSANTYAGPTSVAGGTLILNKAPSVVAVASSLLIGNITGPGAAESVVVRLMNGGQTGAATGVTLFSDGLLDLNNFSTTIGSLTMTGAKVNLGTGDLGLSGTVTVSATATGSLIAGTTGSVDLGAATRTFDVADGAAIYDLDLQARVKNGTLNKTGTGTLRLAGTGASLNVTLNTGTLALANDAALGTAGDTFTLAGGTVVADGGDRTLASAISFTANATIGASLDGTPRALTFTGPMTVSGSRFLTVDNDALTTFGAVELGTGFLAIASTGDATINGVVSSSGAGVLAKTGAGTLTLSGPSANTYTGLTDVRRGTLILDKAAAIVAVAGPLSIGHSAGGGAAESVVVRLMNSGQTTTATDVTLFADGLLDLNNFSTTIGTLTTTGARVNLGTGDLGISGTVTVNATAAGTQITGSTGSLDLGATTPAFDVADGVAAYDLDLQAGVKNGTLNKTGAGTLRLAGTGVSVNVTLNTGTLALANDAALGAAGDTFTLAGGTVVADGGARTLASAISLTGDATIGASLDSAPGALTFTGPMTLTGSRTLTVNNDALTTFGDVALGTNVLTLDGLGETTIAGAITSTGAGNALIKNGTGILGLTGASTYTGDTTVNGGTLFVDGSTSSPITTVSAAATLGGIGTIGGALVNHGVVAPGHDGTGTLRALGAYTQDTAATLTIEIGGRNPGEFDVLEVGTTANLAGTLRLVRLNNFQLQSGDRIVFLTAPGGVNGTFDTEDNAFTTGTIISGRVVYGANDVALLPIQESFTNVLKLIEEQFPQLWRESNFLRTLSPNQMAIARALDQAIKDGKLEKLITFLNAQSLLDLPGDFDRLAPEELAAVFQTSMTLAGVQSQNLQRRTDDLRSGSNGFSAAGLAINGQTPSYSGSIGFRTGAAGPTGNEVRDGAETKAVYSPEPDNRWGVFVSGTGQWVDVDGDDNVRGYDLTTGGFTLGLDYRVTPNFIVGLSAGYAGTDADLANDGRVWVNGGKLGLYATYFTGGFYTDLAVGGGYNSYDTKRDALQGTARGSTEGGELHTLFGAGYDWRIGALKFGPTATFQYTLVGLDSYTERGSLAPLTFADQSAESIRTTVGVKATYDWRLGGVLVKPEIRAAWQHEYGDDKYALDSSFANAAGNAFTVAGPVIGRDSLPLSVGVAMQLTDAVSTYLYYDGELFREDYLSTSVTGGVRVAF